MVQHLADSDRSSLRYCISHIILDEVHERDLHTDILLKYVKDMLKLNAKLKVILMSATIDDGLFRAYFDDCGSINIPGRTFGIEILYLGELLIEINYLPSAHHDVRSAELAYDSSSRSEGVDHQLLCNLITHIHNNNPARESILVFLPGIGSISTQSRRLLDQIEKIEIIILHSEVKDNMDGHDRVFNTINPNVRKIILSTNIAETSLTIPDVKHVIDTGNSKIMMYDAKKDTKQLTLTRISRASADQRAGRTGRTERGRCYRLYSKDTYDNMEKYSMAEIKKASLVDSCLKIKKIIGMNSVGTFFSNTIEPPSRHDVSSAVSMLTSIGALDGNEQITSFGTFALEMPVHVKFAKAILYGIAFRCIETVTYVVSMLSTTSHFKIGATNVQRAEIETIKRTLEEGSSSDFEVLWKIYDGFINQYEKHAYCERNHLSFTSLDIAHNVFNLIKIRLGALHYPHTRNTIGANGIRISQSMGYGSANVNQRHWEIVHMCLAASLYPNVCRVKCNNITNERELCTRFNEVVATIPRSIVRERNLKLDTFVIYDEKTVGRNSDVIGQAAMIPAISFILASENISVDHQNAIITIGQWKIRMCIEALNILLDVRSMLHEHVNAALIHRTNFNITHEEGRDLADRLLKIIQT